MLHDAVSNELYASQTLRAHGADRAAGRTGDADSQQVELQFRPRSVGQLKLVVEIPALAEELETTNNAQQIQIMVIDDKIRVLYVDGYPRYEYRYLKNTLLLE